MRILTTSYRIRISNADKNLLSDLKTKGFKPTTFIREAFREKLFRDMPQILEEQRKAAYLLFTRKLRGE